VLLRVFHRKDAKGAKHLLAFLQGWNAPDARPAVQAAWREELHL
jgi:hypothetical protein